MKKYVLYAGFLLACVQACKKDKEEAKTVPYSLSAPPCLLVNMKTNMSGSETNESYVYDSQRRLLSMTEEGGANTITYTYLSDRIVESQLLKAPEGMNIHTVSTHYLNAGGFITRTIEGDSTQTLYTYNSESYLIKEIKIDLTGHKSSGMSYQYSDGNRISAYALHFDPGTGSQTDSVLSQTYTYYENLPGKMNAWEAWTARLGRPNKNELKHEEGSFTIDYDYKTGIGGMPSSMTLSFMFTTSNNELTWNCD